MLLMSGTTKTDSIAKALNIPPKSLSSELWKRQSAIDSSNVVFIKEIFQSYGYPGKSLVGSPTNETAWYVIQHSSKIPKYLNL